VGTLTGSGTWAVSGGTGAYVGATGAGTLTLRANLFFERGPQGCSEDRGTSIGVIRATGHLRLPGGGPA
jgi:hypothetical protein